MTETNVNRSKLTKRVVESHSPNPSKRILIWDTEVTGFCVRIYPTGKKTYFFQYRNSYRETKFLKIGTHGNTTTEQAREKAVELALKVSAGEDPSVEIAHKPTGSTMKDLAETYLTLHAGPNKNIKSTKEDKAMLKNHILKEFGSRKVDSITFQDVQMLHASLRHTPVQSNRVLSLLHTMFNFSIQWGWRKDNPVSGVKRYQENPRTRWLQDDEMERLLEVLDCPSNQTTSAIVRLLLLTGSRKHEILQATWDQFNLEKSVWTKKAHHTKQKKMEHVPLSPIALSILKELEAKKDNSPFLFPGKVKDKPLQDIKKSWATICKKANIIDCTIHDLRHTYASHLVSNGLSLSIVGKLLGHTQASTTQRYAHLADATLREATTLFGEKVSSLSK